MDSARKGNNADERTCFIEPLIVYALDKPVLPELYTALDCS